MLTRRLSVNLFSMAASKFVGGLLSYLVLLASARLLGVEAYGNFTLSLSIVYLLLPLMDFGIDPLCVKWVSRGEFHRFYSLWNTKLLTTAAVIVVISAVYFLLPRELRIPVIVLCMSMVFTTHITVINSYFRGIEKMIYEAMIICGHRSFILLLACIFISIWKSVIAASCAFVISSFIFLIVAIILINHTRSIPVNILFMFNKKEHVKNLREAYPLALTFLLITIYGRFSSILLASLTDITEVGIFNGALNIIEGLLLVSSIIVTVNFPSLSRLSKEDGFRLFDLVRKLFLILFIISVAECSIIYSLADFLIENILGRQYVNSIDVLKILIFSVLASNITTLLTMLLIAIDLQKIYLLIVGSGTAINIISNLILIPQHASRGAAIAYVITEMLIVAACGTAIYFYKKKQNFAFNQA